MGCSNYFNSQPFVLTSPSFEFVADEELSIMVDGDFTPVGADNVPFASSDSIIQVSNTFNLNANLDGLQPNVVIVSTDSIFFAVHYHRLIAASLNNFLGLLPPNAEPVLEIPLTFVVPDHSDVINIALHCIYGLPCDQFNLPFEVLAASLPVLLKYGIEPSRYLARGTPLYNTFLKIAPTRSVDTYALAASNGLEDLAVAASPYTLSVEIYRMPQHSADQMGTLYLQRLYHLHMSRMSTLKELLDAKLYPHVAKPHCSIKQRQVVHTYPFRVLYARVVDIVC
ncbi:hypothetical protein BC835DRAFT_1423883 [Cytidiella melzeri]|nr:hypothetical protein BC835DRAFT_1423883 [Cytidiella melzeri]